MILNRFFPKSVSINASSLVLSCLFAYALQAQENRPKTPAHPLEEVLPGLRPLVEAAAANSWQMSLQDILVKRAEALSMQYTSRKNTKVNLNVNVGLQRQETATITSEGFNYRFNVTVRKPLYTWGAGKADHRYGLLQVKRVKQDRQLAFLTIYRNMIFKYIDILVFRQRALDNRLTMEISREQLELRRDQVERGEFAATQFATLELAHQRLELRYESLLNTIRKGEDTFREIIGLDENVELAKGGEFPAVASDLSDLEASIEYFLASLSENSLKVQSKQDRLDQENERLKKYSVSQKPKMNGMVRIRRDSDNVITGNRQNLEFTEAFAGFEFNWNLYDSKNTKGFVIDAMQSRRQLERELKILKTDIADDIQYLLADLKILSQQSLLNEKTFAWEQGRYRQQLKDVEEGRAAEKDLKVVKRDMERERTKLYTTRSIFYKTLTNLYVAMENSSILAYLE